MFSLFAARRCRAPVTFGAVWAIAALAAVSVVEAADAGSLKIGARSFDLAPPAGFCLVDPERSPSEHSAFSELAPMGAGVKTAIVFADCRQLADWRGDRTRRITRFGTIAYDSEQIGNPGFIDPSSEDMAAFLDDAAESFKATAGALPDTYLAGEFPGHASSFVAIDHITGVSLAGKPAIADDIFKSYVAAGVVAGEQDVRFGKANGATIFAGTIVVVGVADRIASDGDLQALDADMTKMIGALRAAAETSAPAIAKASEDLPADFDLVDAGMRPTVSEIVEAPPAAETAEPAVEGSVSTVAEVATDPTDKAEQNADDVAAASPAEDTEVAAAPASIAAASAPMISAEAEPELSQASGESVVVEIGKEAEGTPGTEEPRVAALGAPPVETPLPGDAEEAPQPTAAGQQDDAAATGAAPEQRQEMPRESRRTAVLVAPTAAPSGGLTAPPSAPGTTGPVLVPAVTVVVQ